MVFSVHLADKHLGCCRHSTCKALLKPFLRVGASKLLLPSSMDIFDSGTSANDHAKFTWILRPVGRIFRVWHLLQGAHTPWPPVDGPAVRGVDAAACGGTASSPAPGAKSCDGKLPEGAWHGGVSRRIWYHCSHTEGLFGFELPSYRR